MGFPGGSVVRNSPVNTGDASLALELGRTPGEGNGNPLQYSCLENPMDRGAWWDGPWVTKESDTTECLKNKTLVRKKKIHTTEFMHKHKTI